MGVIIFVVIYLLSYIELILDFVLISSVEVEICKFKFSWIDFKGFFIFVFMIFVLFIFIELGGVKLFWLFFIMISFISFSFVFIVVFVVVEKC